MPGVPPSRPVTVPPDAAIVAHALQHGSVSTTDALGIVCAGADPKPADKRLVASRLGRMVKVGWLERDGRTYTPTQRAKDEGGWRDTRESGMAEALQHTIPLDHDPLLVQRERDRIAALMDRVAVLEAAGVEVDAETRETVRLVRATSDDWRQCVPALFPAKFTIDFAPYHAEFWDWIWLVEKGIAPDPWVSVWGRDAGKSSVVEAALIMLGAREVRDYAWIVCATQDAADEHVDGVESALTSSEVSSVFPGMATRDKGKYGPKEWKRNRLVTEAGFVIDAIGLDVAARGRRFEERRANVIALDDIDDTHDTPRVTEKRIATLTRKILPAGSTDCAVMAVQNMIHGRSVFARLANVPGAPEADFLATRRVSGPIKLVNGLETQRRRCPHCEDGFTNGAKCEVCTGAGYGTGYEITGGEATWPARGIAGAQSSLNKFGLTGFLIECQHEEGSLGGGIFEHLDFDFGGGISVVQAALPEPFDAYPSQENGWVSKCCWVDPAVSSTDRSDSMGICVAGLAKDRNYYFLWAWERVTSPLDALRTAILAAVEFGAQVIGVETDQGGDTWETVYRSALRQLMEEENSALHDMIGNGGIVPHYDSRKAGSTGQSKVERASRMLVDFELGKVRMFGENTKPLASGLKRFPVHKPFDCVDAAYWCWRYLAEHGGEQSAQFRLRNPGKRGGGMAGPIAVRR